jgi:hypothetical protein
VPADEYKNAIVVDCDTSMFDAEASKRPLPEGG